MYGSLCVYHKRSGGSIFSGPHSRAVGGANAPVAGRQPPYTCKKKNKEYLKATRCCAAAVL